MSPIKEPKFYCLDLRQRRVTTRDKYERLFREARNDHKIVGEASTSYLYSRVAVPALLAEVPEAKLLVMIRDPVSMARSLHAQLYRHGVEDVADFRRAWNLQDVRKEGDRIPAGCNDPKRLLYGQICSLGTQLDRVYSYASRDQVHVAFLGDLGTDPSTTYRRVLSFLEVSNDGRSEFPHINTRTGVKSHLVARLINSMGRLLDRTPLPRGFGLGKWLVEVNASRKEDDKLGDEFERHLRNYFSDDVRRLETLTGRNLSQWQDGS